MFHHRYLIFFKLTILLFPITPFAAPLSNLTFNFNTFNPNNTNLRYERSAHAEDNIIFLTQSSTANFGRATYAKPLHLWDKASGNLSDLTTHFSFVINSQNRSRYGDGIAFFLAPVGSHIPNTTTKGGTLGLTTDTQMTNATANTFVAVEFDIYMNDFDPEYDHVGIDIDSLQSVYNTMWGSSVEDGKEIQAWISYDSKSKNLSVVFTGFKNSTAFLQGISYVVDLRKHLPEWVAFGFTAATGNRSAIQSIRSWNFTSALLALPSENVTSSSGRRGSGSNRGTVVGLAVGGSVLVCCLGLGLGLFGFWRKRRSENEGDDCELEVEMADELERGAGPKKFSYKELSRATSKFAEEHKLGEGGFGGVYRGFLRALNSQVAVKKVSRGSKQGIKEYQSEVRIISRLRHRNLVQLIGWCHERRQLLLVYEFMPNGSLDCHLFQENGFLQWAERYKIAQGLASALLYLQEEWEQCVVHRDIKSSNVMLDSNFNAKLGDFGLARLVDHEKGLHTTILAGTMGYVAPECIASRKSSKESDVFSFGVVALEIACGRRPINNKAPENQVILVEWVWELYGMGKLLEAADLKLCADFNVEEMERLMVVGLWCAHPDCKLRPSIREAIQVLKSEAPLPVLPSVMPVATYTAPPRTNDGSAAAASESSQIHSSSQTDSSSAASISYSSVLFPR